MESKWRKCRRGATEKSTIRARKAKWVGERVSGWRQEAGRERGKGVWKTLSAATKRSRELAESGEHEKEGTREKEWIL